MNIGTAIGGTIFAFVSAAIFMFIVLGLFGVLSENDKESNEQLSCGVIIVALVIAIGALLHALSK